MASYSYLLFCDARNIFRQERGTSALFANFCRYYVDGFVQLITQITSVNDDPVQVMYPSTVALDELPDGMLEYCAAKAAGETAASAMAKEKSTCSLMLSSSRIDTNQTQSSAGSDRECGRNLDEKYRIRCRVSGKFAKSQKRH